MNNVQILKLSSGEELIGKVSDIEIEGRQLIQIEKPAVVMLVPDKIDQSKFGIALAPYAPYADKNLIHIMPSHIIAIFVPANALLNEYNATLGSKVIIPENEIKV